VLSGFVLTHNYIDAASGRLRGTVREFWWARVARVYPVYLVALAFSLPEVLGPLWSPRSPEAAARAARAVVLAPALLQSLSPSAACAWNCPAWSLSVEAFFYLLFPLAGVWLARRGRRGALACAGLAWVLGLLAAALYLAVKPDGLSAPTHADSAPWLNALKFNPLVHLPEFLTGVAAGVWLPGLVVAEPSEPHLRRRARRLRAAAGIAVGATCAVLAIAPGLPFVFLHTGLLAPVWALAVLALALGGGPVAAVLGSRPLVRLGEASYALYLFHSPLHVYVRVALERGLGLRLPSGWEMVVQFAVALAASLAIFDWIERPARNYVRARVQRMRPRAHTAACV
jgi:peptidoglycan/LPS O-acetylase OafA/YrhL